MNSGRRDFFKVVGTAAAAAAAASPILKPAESAAALPNKGFTAGYLHSLVLEQTPAGFVRSLDGGEIVGVVVKEPVDQYGVVRKHLGGIRYEDISISFSGGMSPAVYNWIRVFLARDPALHSGSIVSYDYRYKPQTQLDFTDARISEVVFPEFNVASKEVATLDLRLTPGSVQYAVPSLSAPLDIKKQVKASPVSTFRLEIGGIDSTATSRVRKINAITFRQNAAVASLGEVRTASIDVEPLDIEPIVLTISEQFAKPFFDWHRNFLAQGEGAQETYLIIESLSANGKEVLFSLFFSGVGIVRVSRLKEDAKAEAARNVEVELYAEQVSFYQGPVPSA